MMTRLSAGFALALVLAAGTTQEAAALPGAPAAALAAADSSFAPSLRRVEYYCSPGFEPSYGGTCVAVPPRPEIELFVDQPIYAAEEVRPAPRRYRRHRHGLRERF